MRKSSVSHVSPNSKEAKKDPVLTLFNSTKQKYVQEEIVAKTETLFELCNSEKQKSEHT